MISFVDNYYMYYDLYSCREDRKPFRCQWAYNSTRIEMISGYILSGNATGHYIQEVEVSSDYSRMTLGVL